MDRDAVRRAWDAVAEDYARNRRADGEDARLIDELVAELPADAVVLDVGCGDGRRTLANLGDVTAVGLDVSRRQLELAGEAVPSARLLQGEMTAIPLEADAVDGITAYHAVFHVAREDHPAVYREFARVLRPGGHLLLTVSAGRYETTRANWLGSEHPMFWSAPGQAETRAQLEAAGFRVLWERVVDDPLGSEVPFALARLTA